MRAAVVDRFGGPEVVKVGEAPTPGVGRGEVGVQVVAGALTTADVRLRSASFPRGFGLVGRLFAGLFRPRHPVLGVAFAGRVAEVGEGVEGFAPGDAVFGFSGSGGHGERLTVKASGPIARMPDGLSFAEAASVTFGAITALVFLRDVLQVRAGQSLLVLGAAGDCGGWFVQLARHYGVEVTASCSVGGHDHVRALGAHHVVDRHRPDPWAGLGPFDAVVDTVGSVTFAEVRPLLRRDGGFVPLVATTRELLQAVWTWLVPGPRVRFAIVDDRREDVEVIASLLAAGAVRPAVDRVFPLNEIQAAHRWAGAGRKRGAVVVQVDETSP